MTVRRILITGCSGGGKSTLLARLASRGFATVPEQGRRIVAEEQAGTGAALPWVDPEAFARRARAMAWDDLRRVAPVPGPVFFDRGVIDAASALAHLTGDALADTLGGPSPYARPVFFAPPWPEIFARDEARRHGIDAALEEVDRLSAALPALGHAVYLLPKVGVEARVAFVLRTLGLD